MPSDQTDRQVFQASALARGDPLHPPNTHPLQPNLKPTTPSHPNSQVQVCLCITSNSRQLSEVFTRRELASPIECMPCASCPPRPENRARCLSFKRQLLKSHMKTGDIAQFRKNPNGELSSGFLERGLGRTARNLHCGRWLSSPMWRDRLRCTLTGMS